MPVENLERRKLGERQERLLLERVLGPNRECEFGRRHRFSSIRSVAERVAQAIHETLAGPLVVEGHELPGAASIGIAFREDDCETAEQLFRNADAAVYYAKAEGPPAVPAPRRVGVGDRGACSVIPEPAVRGPPHSRARDVGRHLAL